MKQKPGPRHEGRGYGRTFDERGAKGGRVRVSIRIAWGRPKGNLRESANHPLFSLRTERTRFDDSENVKGDQRGG